MKRDLLITPAPIVEPDRVGERAQTKTSGAAVYFSGLVREIEGGARLEALEYETFEKMAVHQFQLIFDAIQQKWPVESIRVIHRVGVVPVGESSLWIEVLAPHRREAFAACEFLIDELKKTVPIWKKSIPRP